VDAYLDKPVDPEILLAEIEKLLTKKARHGAGGEVFNA
jgi:DNA-binding response OmpR family regulator